MGKNWVDRSLIDRCIFTDTLFRRGEIDAAHAQSVSASLTLSRLLENLNGVFIFVTSPEIALERDYANKLIQSEGGVMNISFLTTMRSAVVDGYNNVHGLIPNVQLIDTEQDNGYLQETARFAVNNILSVIKEK